MTTSRTHKLHRLGAALLVAVAACRSATGGSAPGASAPSPSPSTRAAAGPALPTGAAKARADSARLPYTAADIEFMQGMIHHHAQAIRMSEWAPTHGASPAVLTLASRIINAQRDEIATMQQWLRDRNQEVPEATPGPMRMKMGGMEHEMLMPGMLTDEQMKQLDAARGPEFDRLFLTFMMQHHRGAVAMVKALFDTYGAGQDETVFKFANDVSVDQTTEIARMQRLLADVMFEK